MATATELRGSPPPLDLRVADALLHIGREAISNAISHGFPSALRTTLECSEKNVLLQVEDDGCGFALSPGVSGFGILGMQKRAREIAGQLTIRSSPAGGTSVTVEAALRPEQGKKATLRRVAV